MAANSGNIHKIKMTRAAGGRHCCPARPAAIPIRLCWRRRHRKLAIDGRRLSLPSAAALKLSSTVSYPCLDGRVALVFSLRQQY